MRLASLGTLWWLLVMQKVLFVEMERGSNPELEVLTDLEEIMFATFLLIISTTITDQFPKNE